MSEMIRELGTPLEAEELVVKEVASFTGTWSKGKGRKSKVVNGPEEKEYYDLPVHHAIKIFYKYFWSICFIFSVITVLTSRGNVS